MFAMLAGCTSPTTSPSPSPSPTANTGSGLGACEGAELRGPDGVRVNLTGTWQGEQSSGLWLVTQSGACVTMEGLSTGPNEPLGHLYRAVFSGDLGPDFTIAGRWMWTWYFPPARNPDDPRTGQTHPLTLRVTFDAENQPLIQLSDLYSFQFGVTLQRIDPSTQFPNLEAAN